MTHQPRTCSERARSPRRGPRIGVLALIGVAFCSLSIDAIAEPIEALPGEARYSVPFVPAMHGAFGIEGGVTDSWPLGAADPAPPTLAGATGLGWRTFLDDHGALGLLTQLRLARTLSSTRGTVTSLGGTLGLMVRGYTPQFLYGGAGLLVGGDFLSWSGGEDSAGGRFGGGLETSAGMLWHLRPYIFGEFAAQIWLERTWLGPLDQVQVSARWVLRIELGARADAPEEDRDALYRTNPPSP